MLQFSINYASYSSSILLFHVQPNVMRTFVTRGIYTHTYVHKEMIFCECEVCFSSNGTGLVNDGARDKHELNSLTVISELHTEVHAVPSYP